MSEYTRRRLLAIGGTVTAAAIAGCAGGDGDGGTADADTAGGGPVLEAVSIENLDDTGHTVDVIIRWGDEIDYWTTHELDAIGDTDSSLALDAEWRTEPGEFQLTARLDDDSRAQFSSSQLADRDCLDLVIMVSREGELSILTDVSGGACASDEERDSDESTE